MTVARDPLAFGPLLLLDDAGRARLREHAVARKLKPGETLIEERSTASDAYVLTEGALRVVTSEDRTLAIVGPPALVGDMAIVQERQRSATVVADTPCAILVLPGDVLRQLISEQRLFAVAMRERTDLMLADAFLKRRSPLRDLPSTVVSGLAAQLRPRILAEDQLVEGRDDDILLVRRGALQRQADGQRTEAGDFLQRVAGERYAAAGETWVYELRIADVAAQIARHQERMKEIVGALDDRVRVKAQPDCRVTTDPDLGGALVHDGRSRAIVSSGMAALVPSLDGRHDLASLLASSGLGRGELVNGLATLIAADLAGIAPRGMSIFRR